MPQILPYSGAKTYDVWNNPDEANMVGTYMMDVAGTQNDSNTVIFDRLFQTDNTKINQLRTDLDALALDNYIIHFVDLILDTSIIGSSAYTGTNSNIDAFKENYLYLFRFNNTNIGNVQININSFGYSTAYIIKNGISVNMSDGDITQNSMFLFVFQNNQFILVNKDYDTQINSLTTNVTNILNTLDTINTDITSIKAKDVEQDNEIADINTKIAALDGAVIHLGTINYNTADITQQRLTDRAQQILSDRGQSTDLKQGYALIDLDLNDWIYDATSSLWVNVGTNIVPIATNTTLGIVMGVSGSGSNSISVQPDGTMRVNTATVSQAAAEAGTSSTVVNWTPQRVRQAAIASIPTGSIQQYAGTTAPTGWLLCQGQDISRTTYSNLFNVCGLTYGAGNGSTTFNIPNLSSRFPIGTDNSYPLGDTGGNNSITIAKTNLPNERIEIISADGTAIPRVSAVAAEVNYGISGGENIWQSPYLYTKELGNGTSINTTPRFIVLNYIIKT